MRPHTLRTLRRYHHYLGVFFAPFILLFAVSGALQTFRLTEAKGYGGPPPTWLLWLASVHKDQAPPREPKAGPPKAAIADEHADADHHDADHQGADHGDADHHDADHADHHHDDAPAGGMKRPSPLPLKIFVVLLAISLAVTTIIGVVIALSNRAMRRVSIGLLVAGAVLPCVLLWL